MNVVTTLDSRLQAAANSALKNALQEYDRRHGYRGPIRRVDEAALPVDTDENGLSVEQQLGLLLTGISSPGQLQPAIVLAVGEESARVYGRGAGIIELPMAGLAWAAPAGSGRALGPRPRKPADVLAVGDVIHV
jgi:penicillin-binding protein 1A